MCAIGLFDEAEELLGALDVGFVVHHSSLSSDFILVLLRVIVLRHCKLILTVCRKVVHLHIIENTEIKFDWLL